MARRKLPPRDNLNSVGKRSLKKVEKKRVHAPVQRKSAFATYRSQPKAVVKPERKLRKPRWKKTGPKVTKNSEKKVDHDKNVLINNVKETENGTEISAGSVPEAVVKSARKAQPKQKKTKRPKVTKKSKRIAEMNSNLLENDVKETQEMMEIPDLMPEDNSLNLQCSGGFKSQDIVPSMTHIKAATETVDCDTYKIVSLTDNRSMILFGFENDIKVFGCGCIKVLKGKVSMLGLDLLPENKEEKFYSPQSSPAIVLEPFPYGSEMELHCILDYIAKKSDGTSDCMEKNIKDMLQSYSVVVLLSYIPEYEHFLFPGYLTLFQMRSEYGEKICELNRGAVMVRTKRHFCSFESYNSACAKIMDKVSEPGTRPPVVLAVGGKGTGKSTFNRFLLNKLLKCFPVIKYLDCDVGQPEFTPPGFISQTSVSSPLLGPPFTHLTQPSYALYFGNIVVSQHPDYYIACCRKVWSTISPEFPIIVNTLGWNKGLGLNLLMDIIRIVRPTHIIQMDSSRDAKKMPLMKKDFASNHISWIMDMASPIPRYDHILIKEDLPIEDIIFYKQSDQRNLRIMRYLLEMQQAIFDKQFGNSDAILSLSKLCSVQPFRVKVTDVLLCVCHEPGILKSHSLAPFNGGLVGLCTVSPEDFNEGKNGDHLRQPPVSMCHGLGIVRGVNKDRNCLYIISHLDASCLKTVNCLCLGSVSLPECMYFDTKDDNSIDMISPYVTGDFPFEVQGTATFRNYKSFPKRR